MTFPGGTSVSRLAVYTGLCVDGFAGGTPHLHTVSTEAYVVTGGTGALQTLDASGFRETPLRAGSLVWFTPGVIHRAINHGDLEVLVVMSNAGLPEAGDAVMTFPPDVLATPESYRAAAVLTAETDAAVAYRRDLAVEGFLALRTATLSGDPAPLHAFYAAAARLVRDRVPRWREIWESTVAAQAGRTAGMLAALEAGDATHLREGGVLAAPPSETAGWGMCGRLRTHDVRNPENPGGAR
ncbi:cupin domain-containing protein [Catenuloplanes atrovinosus]|uniref:Mannose-6-phosphate isomerase-like protein (Cupin superfamily) n=1 Tax=Catenuloplanes atrovinosus TaxID=137266 RepID=A0AAE4C975_9ACTN|nr:cupin domain-containing protein [Catenuloplanes atrovinosus]MDR7276266.1 mannose-6-phosphate isomerase-like protein (cupin superfamily) [Catenuloplanes atrovinosus]